MTGYHWPVVIKDTQHGVTDTSPEWGDREWRCSVFHDEGDETGTWQDTYQGRLAWIGLCVCLSLSFSAVDGVLALVGLLFSFFLFCCPFFLGGGGGWEVVWLVGGGGGGVLFLGGKEGQHYIFNYKQASYVCCCSIIVYTLSVWTGMAWGDPMQLTWPSNSSTNFVAMYKYSPLSPEVSCTRFQPFCSRMLSFSVTCFQCVCC